MTFGFGESKLFISKNLTEPGQEGSTKAKVPDEIAAKSALQGFAADLNGWYRPSTFPLKKEKSYCQNRKVAGGARKRGCQ